MTLLGDKQRLFGRLLPRLLDKAQELHPGGVVLGEAARSEAAAKWYASQRIGIANSLHRLRLAVDIHLFREDNGVWVYLTSSEDHRELGEWWEKQHELARWGGRFLDSRGRPKPDGNHYSLEHEGVR